MEPPAPVIKILFSFTKSCTGPTSNPTGSRSRDLQPEVLNLAEANWPFLRFPRSEGFDRNLERLQNGKNLRTNEPKHWDRKQDFIDR
jgi:hypothetical protein